MDRFERLTLEDDEEEITVEMDGQTRGEETRSCAHDEGQDERDMVSVKGDYNNQCR